MNKEQLVALQVKHNLPATVNVYEALLAAFDAGVESAKEAKGLSADGTGYKFTVSQVLMHQRVSI